ncbi:M20/M25/M40 family metallo-hydrolase, partial [Porphyromonas loveana]
GSVEKASASYIIRDHDRKLFDEKKELMTAAVAFINKKYGFEVVALELRDQYYNMREMVEPHPEIIEKAMEAMQLAGVTPKVQPIRGGTDGARLSYMGLPCPNLFAGGMNFHGKYEYCSLDSMQRAVETICHLAVLWAK